MLMCLIYLVLLVGIGYAAVRWMRPDRPQAETIGVAACIGPGIMGLLLIYISMLGLKPQRWEILLMGIPLCTAAGWMMKSKSRREREKRPKRQISEKVMIVLCLLAIGYGIGVSIHNALIYPTLEWDAFAIWQIKAKVLSTLALNPKPAYFTDLTLSYSHLRYPILVPMISAGVHAMTGDPALLEKAPSLLILFGLALALYSFTRERRGIGTGMIVAAILLNVTPTIRYGGSGTAELGLTAFYGCSIICLLRWVRENQWGDLILCAIFTAAMAWTKNEGIALALINLLAILLFTRADYANKAKAFALAAIIIFVLFAPWLIWSHGLPRTDEDYAARINIHELSTQLSRIPVILTAFARQFISPSQWGLFWVILFLLIMLQYREFQHRETLMLAVLLVLHLLAYIPPMIVVRGWNLEELLSVTTDRLVLHTLPVALLLLAEIWPSWLFNPPIKERVLN